ncbi:MAG TPA: dienelactone hydrolase family protein [Naasia sp.]|jgi:dienelactone hydrolase
MSIVAIFPSVLGVRAGERGLADALERAGHSPRIIDLLDGRVFDDYEEAGAFTQALGFEELTERAVNGVADLDDGFVVAGFSNGAAAAQRVAVRRAVAGAILFAGAIPLEWVGAESWPRDVAVQVHASREDPFWDEGTERFAAEAVRAQASFSFFAYPGAGHLFTDPTLTAEHSREATEVATRRVLAFLDDVKG